MPTRTLYRPVGVAELRLIFDLDMQEFPPRLDWQPIFYPVLNFNYAVQIARDWNTRDSNSGYAGYVTAFDVDAGYLTRFEIQTVGATSHQELWVPAEELADFNQHIDDYIRVEAAFYGDKYDARPLPQNLKSNNLLRDFVEQNAASIYLNWLYWQNDPATDSNPDLLQQIETHWSHPFPLPKART